MHFKSNNEKKILRTLPIAPRTIVASEQPLTIAYFKGASKYITESWQFKICRKI